MRDFFVGRRDTFTEQQLPDSPKAYLTAVGPDREKKALTDPELMAHCRGENTISTYLVDDQGTTPVAVLDIDSKEEPAKQIIIFAQNWLKGYGLHGFVEPSGRKGYHIWIIFKARLPAAKAKRILEALMLDWAGTWDRWAQAEKKPFPFSVVDKDKSQGPLLVDFEGKEVRLPFLVEINPKQEGKTTKEAPGNCVKLPWGKHRITDRWTAFLDDKGQIPQDWGMSMILQSSPVTEVMLDDILKKYPAKEEAPRQRIQSKFVKTPKQSSEEFNVLAVKLALDSCAFLQHCAKDAADLSRNQWFCMVDLLAPFGDAGAKKIHELSSPYPKYSPKETDQYIDSALKALTGTGKKKVGPYTCVKIQETMSFTCPSSCQAQNLEANSPAGLAFKLANQELIVKRTHSVTIITTKTGKQKVLVHCPTLAEEMMEDFHFRCFRETKDRELLVYGDDGVYRRGAEWIVAEEVKNRLLGLFNRRRSDEVLEYVKSSSFVSREQFNRIDCYVVNVENGLLDLKSLELRPHSPEFLTTVQVPVKYDLDAQCPVVEKFLSEVLEALDIPKIYELSGYCLDPTYLIHRAFLFLGSGANGKTTLMELLSAFLGQENCASVSLQELTANRFASAALWGKLANIYDDLPCASLRETGIYKMLTGGGTSAYEEKYRPASKFRNRAKMIFAANQAPRVPIDETDAFWRRSTVIPFPHQFQGETADKNLIQKLTTPAELSGFLNKALAGLQRLYGRGEFTETRSLDDERETWRKSAEPIYGFVMDRCVLDPEKWIAKDDLHGAYVKYCRDNRRPPLTKGGFGRRLLDSLDLGTILDQRETIGATIGAKRRPGWKGIGLKEGPAELEAVPPDIQF